MTATLNAPRFFLTTTWAPSESLLSYLDIDVPSHDLSREEVEISLSEVWQRFPDQEIVLSSTTLSLGPHFSPERPLRLQIESGDLVTPSTALTEWLRNGRGIDLWIDRPLSSEISESLKSIPSRLIRIVYVQNTNTPFANDLEHLKRFCSEVRIWFPPIATDSYRFLTAKEFWLWKRQQPFHDHLSLFYRNITGAPLNSQASLFFHDGVTDPFEKKRTRKLEYLFIQFLLLLERQTPHLLKLCFRTLDRIKELRRLFVVRPKTRAER